MSIGPTVFLTVPSDTSTSQIAPVGTVRAYNDSTYGHQLYRLVKASAAIAAYKVVEFDDGLTGLAAEADTNFVVAAKIAGVSQNAIASGSYGWVVCSGLCKVTTAAAVAAGAAVVTKGASASGAVDDTAYTDVEESIIGIFTELAGSATTTSMRISGVL